MPPSSSSFSRRWPGVFRLLAVFAAVLVFIFLAWRASPWFSELHWMPRPLARWSDHHGVARNVLGFFGFGAVFFASVGRRWPQFLSASFFAVALEVGQLWIPRRLFDLKDIYASLLGLALAWLAVAGIARILRGSLRPC